MRIHTILLFMIIAILAWPDRPAQAENDILSPLDFAHIKETFNQCSSTARNLFYDCECVSIHNLDLTRRFENRLDQFAYDDLERTYERNRQQTELLRKSYDQCSNLSKVAMMNYNSCVGWAITERADYNEFCQCYAIRYADRFSANGTSSFFDAADARAQAIASCNANPHRAQKPSRTSPSAFR